MSKKILTIIGIFLVVAVLYYCFDFKQAKALSRASDRIDLSWPATAASHTITFQTTKAIPASGSITITPEAGDFFIPGGMDYAALDLATSSLLNGTYADRLLAAAPSATEDGVSVVASTTSGSITITLNSNQGIATGTYVRIEIGSIADYQATSAAEIINPSLVGGYGIEAATYNQAHDYLERAKMMIAIVEPVYTSTYVKLIRSNGSPNGWLANGTTQTIMSIQTNFLGTCRYSTASGTSFNSMTDEFTTTGGYLHTHVISGLSVGQTYDVYIRCRDDTTMDVDQTTECYYGSTSPWKTASGTAIQFLDCLDYWIQFAVSSIPGAEGDESGLGGSTGGGGGGGGKGGGLGTSLGRGVGEYLPYPPPPGAPGVIFEGYAYRNADVVILKDGVQQGLALASEQAEFGAFLEELTQGIYTFGVWSNDSQGRRSITYSTTFWIDEGTQSTVSNIFLPPTISLTNNSVSGGQPLEVKGETVPSAKVEVWLYPDQVDVKDEEILKKDTIAAQDGTYSITFSTTGLEKGKYKIKPKGNVENVGDSDFGQILEVAIDETISEQVCAGADLNGDGKVNITDFSILLYYWGTDDSCADQNQDGKVDLTDFSIMMFYWTG